MKKKTLTTIILIVALAMVAAVTVYAVANYGTKDDPLVTSSYLQDVVQPRMEDAYRSTLDGQISEMEDQFADQVAAAGGSYVLVTLENGDEALFAALCESMAAPELYFHIIEP